MKFSTNKILGELVKKLEKYHGSVFLQKIALAIYRISNGRAVVSEVIHHTFFRQSKSIPTTVESSYCPHCLSPQLESLFRTPADHNNNHMNQVMAIHPSQR